MSERARKSSARTPANCFKHYTPRDDNVWLLASDERRGGGAELCGGRGGLALHPLGNEVGDAKHKVQLLR